MIAGLNGFLSLLKVFLPFPISAFFINHLFAKSQSMAALRSYFNHSGMREFWKKYPNKKNRNHRVIVYGLRTYATHHQCVFEKVFTDCFRFHGANVKNLICNDVLPSCDGSTKGLPDWVICHKCHNERKAHVENFPNDFISFDQFICKEEVAAVRKSVESLTDGQLENHEYLGINVGRYAADSVSRAFQFPFDTREAAHRRELRESVLRGMLTVVVAKNLLRIERPTHIFTLHGCYATWGPFAEYLSNSGVKVYIHRVLLNPGMGYFDFPRWTDDMNDIPGGELWERRRSEPLTAHQREKIKNYLENKKKGKTADYQIFYEQKTGTDDKFVKLLNSDKKKYVLYMQSLWDRGFEKVKSDCFENPIDWLKQTIAYFQKNNSAYLFIKPHPAECSMFEQRRSGGADVVMNMFSDLPDNILILGKNLPYTSYDLMDKGCVGITYYGTVGLEHSFFKKPIIVGAHIHYTRVGAAHKIRSRKEYFDLLDNPEPLYNFPVEHYDVIEKYAYHYYFSNSLLIPFYKQDQWLGHCIDWSVLSDYADFIENNKTMNHVVCSILNGKDVVDID